MKEKIIKVVLTIIGVLIVIFLVLEIFGLRINYGFFTYKEPDIPDECKKLPSKVTGRWTKQVASQCLNCLAVPNRFDISDTGEENISHYLCSQSERLPLFRRIK